MYTIAKLDEKNRDAIFTKYAYDNKLNKAIVEKDFWVTFGVGLFISQITV